METKTATTYRIRFSGYCGMSYDLATCESMLEARASVARVLARRRAQGFPVMTLERGMRWEILEPAGAALVPDACGTLYITVQYPPAHRDECECDDCAPEAL